MVKESKSRKNVVETAFIMALLTLVSKVIGFLREMAMATFFGTSFVVDAYVMAIAIPGILFAALLASIATAYMPLLSERIEKSGRDAGDIFTSQIIRILLAVSAVVFILGLAFSNELVSVFAPGFKGETVALTSFFLKITFSYLIFTSITGILDSFLQYHNTFIPQILFGYVQNIILIVVIIVSSYTSYYFLAFGMLIAYIFRFIAISFLAKSIGYNYSRNRENFRNTIKKIMALGIPVFIGSGMGQINVFVDKALASGLPEGSIAALNYANILNTLVMGLSVTVLATIIYPKLTRAIAQEQFSQFGIIMQKGLAIAVMIALPFSLGSMIYSEEIVQIVFERGAFDISATSLTAGAYFFYSIGIVFKSVNLLIVRGFYALHDMKTPMLIAGVGVAVNITLNLILIDSMAHMGLALSTSIAASTSSVLLIITFNIKNKKLANLVSPKKYVKIILVALISIGISKLVFELLINSFWMPRIIYLCIAVFVAACIYWLLLKVLKIEEIELVEVLFKKKKKTE